MLVDIPNNINRYIDMCYIMYYAYIPYFLIVDYVYHYINEETLHRKYLPWDHIRTLWDYMIDWAIGIAHLLPAGHSLIFPYFAIVKNPLTWFWSHENIWIFIKNPIDWPLDLFNCSMIPCQGLCCMTIELGRLRNHNHFLCKSQKDSHSVWGVIIPFINTEVYKEENLST